MIKQRKIEKLDFIVAGAQKCGTTALHYFLEKHPHIALPNKQELHFFDNDDLFAQEADYTLLHESFTPNARALIAGESTPSYLYSPSAMERIWNYDKEIKLIILLRNPVLRAFSHWNMQRERGFENLDFLEAVKEEHNRLRQASPQQSRRFSYIQRGLYAQQLERVFRFFRHEQIKVVRFEEFRKDQSEVLNSIFVFIGAKPLSKVRSKERNIIRYEREITDAEYEHVARLFAHDIVKLEKLLGWNCSDWKL